MRHTCGKPDRGYETLSNCRECSEERDWAYQRGLQDADDSRETAIAPATALDALVIIATELRGIRRALWRLHDDPNGESALVRAVEGIAEGLNPDLEGTFANLAKRERE